MTAPLAQRIMGPYRAVLGGLDRRVHVVAAASFLFIIARMGLVTFLAIYFVGQVGLALPLVGLGFLVENVFRALASPLAGAASDRFGRRAVMVGSAAASAVVFPGFLLVRDPASLLLWAAVAGTAQGPYFPAANALLLDLAAPERRQSTLAYHYTVLSLGYTLGVVPAGFLAQQGYALLAAQSAIAFALVAALVLAALRGAMPRETTPPEASVLRAALRAPRDPAFAALAVLGFLFPLGIGIVGTALPVYARDSGLGEAAVGAVLGLSGILLAALALPANARIEAQGPYRWLPLAALATGATYLAFAFAPGLPGLAFGLVLFTLGEVVFSSALPTAVSHLAPPGARGAYQGAWQMVYMLGIGSAVALAGLGRDTVGWPITWFLFAAHAGLAVIVLAWAHRRFHRVAEARQAGASAASS